MDQTVSQTKLIFFTKQNLIHLTISILILVALFYIYTGLMLAIPEFSELSRAFSVEVPVITQFMYENFMYYPYLFYIEKISFIIYFLTVFISGISKSLFKKIALTNFAVCVLVTATTFFFMYLPIFKMDSVV
ncbi:hypothetical protein [Motiliproteus sp. MSK22-1]|uniref:hypothetical protein n=1 Tax=Motiliproteus sp. MSK22-1 TaxID=1897630 RepID=UPI0009788AE9|nr:hypothetical protein [Motiliproteus sp. MSK22-1]OMH37983.1 hypothetical protein BGP75_06760 [Motiliproteus sp. MSK22-1]